MNQMLKNKKRNEKKREGEGNENKIIEKPVRKM